MGTCMMCVPAVPNVNLPSIYLSIYIQHPPTYIHTYVVIENPYSVLSTLRYNTYKLPWCIHTSITLVIPTNIATFLISTGSPRSIDTHLCVSIQLQPRHSALQFYWRRYKYVCLSARDFQRRATFLTNELHSFTLTLSVKPYIIHLSSDPVISFSGFPTGYQSRWICLHWWDEV